MLSCNIFFNTIGICLGDSLGFTVKRDYLTKNKVSDKNATIEKKLDRIIELLEKDKGA